MHLLALTQWNPWRTLKIGSAAWILKKSKRDPNIARMASYFDFQLYWNTIQNTLQRSLSTQNWLLGEETNKLCNKLFAVQLAMQAQKPQHRLRQLCACLLKQYLKTTQPIPLTRVEGEKKIFLKGGGGVQKIVFLFQRGTFINYNSKTALKSVLGRRYRWYSGSKCSHWHAEMLENIQRY